MAASEPFEVDPESVERGTRGHRITQNALARFLIKSGLEPRRRKPGEPFFDLAWQRTDETYVAEVKSLNGSNDEKQLRLGLGQVLRNLLSRDRGTVRAVLASEYQPEDDTWASLCDELGVVPVWPGVFDRLLAT